MGQGEELSGRTIERALQQAYLLIQSICVADIIYKYIIFMSTRCTKKLNTLKIKLRYTRFKRKGRWIP